VLSARQSRSGIPRESLRFSLVPTTIRPPLHHGNQKVETSPLASTRAGHSAQP
jgi:hypothetical protein